MRERLQKIIARAGIASRRAAEDLITKGRIRVNGKLVTELGAQADPFEDKVELDGKRLLPESLVYVVLHKPRDVVSTLSDPEGRPTVKEMLTTAGGRVYPVGRLDFATSGVLLATNDGEFAHALLHPKKEVPKTYVLKVRGAIDEDALELWRTGIDLEDGRTLPAKARLIRHEGDKSWVEVILREGRNQQIRRMGDATGFPVMRLARTTFAGITSDGLRPGEWRPISAGELNALREAYGVPRRIPKDVPKRSKRAPVTRGMSPRPGYEDGQRNREREREREGRDARIRLADGPSEPVATPLTDAPAQEARPTRDTRPTRDAAPPRDARPARDTRPTRGPAPDRGPRDTRPARDAEPARGGRSNRGPAPARDTRPARDAEPARGGRSNRGPAPTRDAEPARDGRSNRGPVPTRDAEPARGGRSNRGPVPTRDAEPARGGRSNRGPVPTRDANVADDRSKSERSDRSGTKPRGAAAPEPRARGPVGRSKSRGRP